MGFTEEFLDAKFLKDFSKFSRNNSSLYLLDYSRKINKDVFLVV